MHWLFVSSHPPGKKKLNIPHGDKVTLVLESDGTEVDSDDFIVMQPAGTAYLLLQDGDVWTPQLQRVCVANAEEVCHIW